MKVATIEILPDVSEEADLVSPVVVGTTPTELNEAPLVLKFIPPGFDTTNILMVDEGDLVFIPSGVVNIDPKELKEATEEPEL